MSIVAVPEGAPRVWVLGAPDPEMEAIERLLRGEGERVIHALNDAGMRVSAGGAYTAANTHEIPKRGDVYFVECFLPGHSAQVNAHTIDHHRPGDPGWGLPPERYFEGSSIGQVWQTLFPGRSPSPEVLLVAAADHCLPAAYQGRCPGVDPDDLMRWRAASRAHYQERSVEAVLEDIANAITCLRNAPRIYMGGHEVADLRAQGQVPELPEAAARASIPFIALATESGGRRKVVLQAAPPAAVAHFIEEWGPENGLKEMYGSPNRGYAGGYVK